MNTGRLTIIVILASLVWQAAPAQTTPDTSSWACESCPAPVYRESSFALGVGWVDDPSYKFQDFSGLDEGAYPVVGGSALRIDEDDYWRIDLHQLGLRSREIAVDGGEPGKYRLRARYVELPNFLTDSARTIYPDAGAGIIELPGSWVRGPNTQSLSALETSLRPLRLRQDRERFAFGVDLTPPGRWRYRVDFDHETKQGVRAVGGGFLFTSALLPSPVDYVTDQIDAAAIYETDRWQAELSYYGSFFDNHKGSLTWDNPLNPLVPGATQGQLALAPDNELHRVGLSGRYRIGERTRLYGSLGVGRMNQDADYLAYTVNDNLAAAALPANSLDGRVDVIDLIARIDSRLGTRGRVEAQYRYYERDNDSPVLDYRPITMDLFVNPARRNRPYSYDRQSLSVEGGYRVSSALRLAAGAEYETFERSREEAADTDEGLAWARANFSLGGRVDGFLKLGYQDRDGDDLDPAAALAEADNPLLRKYHYADRERQEVRVLITVTPHDRVQLGFGGGFAEDDYDESILGLNDSEYQDLSLDLAVTPAAGTSVHAFYTWENIESEVSNNETLTGTDWFGVAEDTIRTYGAGVEFADIAKRGAGLAIDYVYSRAEGEYRIDAGLNAAPFPDLITRLEGIRLRFSYPLKKGAELVLDYYHERFESRDWGLDGVAPDEVFNLLTLGELAPEYNIDSFAVFYRAAF